MSLGCHAMTDEEEGYKTFKVHSCVGTIVNLVPELVDN